MTVPEPSETRDLDPRSVARFRELPEMPAALSLRGRPGFDAAALLDERPRRIAIVGSRRAFEDAAALTRELAGACARAGAIVVSGGAVGIDAAAHEGAIDAGGVTWSVLPCGCDAISPPNNAALFARIVASGGLLVHPFARSRGATGHKSRNWALAALADVVVIMQGGTKSGTRHAASCARALGRTRYALRAPPWMRSWAACAWAIEEGAVPFDDVPGFARAELAAGSRTEPRAIEGLSEAEAAVLAAASGGPKTLESIVDSSGLAAADGTRAVLTLVFNHVLIETPDGRFRRV